MNRPRNRQARPPRSNNKNDLRSNTPTRGNATDTNSNVPSTVQVIPAAAVSIVQKADQPTGREVRGIVEDVLTRGNHPRGIKVRLQDGRVGRVQRMASTSESASVDVQPAANSMRADASFHDSRNTENEHRTGNSDISSNLADYVVPRKNKKARSPLTQDPLLPRSTVVARCPICEVFEGDELAVSYHVQEHLTEDVTPPD